jgi:hypothetical protein
MSKRAHDYTMAQVLGYASLGIAAVELFAPDFLARQMGIKPHPRIMRSLGGRELASGVSILTQGRTNDRLAGGLWSRVMGDAIDGALLTAAGVKSQRKGRFAAILAVVVGIAVLDVIYAKRIQDDVD